MKKKLAWVCLMVSPLVLGGAALFLPSRDPITQANCDKIKEDMTLKEVVAILGKENLDGQGNKWGPTECHLNSSQMPLRKRAFASARGRSKCMKLS
jgi:hypothetical protein